MIASLPITYAASLARGAVEGAGVRPDGLEVALRILMAIIAGGAGLAVWQLIQRSNSKLAVRVQAYVQDSAWDQTLQDVQEHARPTELVMQDGSRYKGTIRYAGREDHRAEPWVYLIYPEIYDKALSRFREARGTHGILVYRDQIARIRVLKSASEARDERHEVTDRMTGT